MFNLPSFFTGYYSEASGFSEFKKMCFSLSNLGFFEIKEVIDSNYPNNYYSAVILDEDGEKLFVQNCFVPYAAFVETTEDEWGFFNSSITDDVLNTLGIDLHIMNKKELMEEITKEHKKQLSTDERKEIEFWLPCQVGQILFSSCFD